MELQEVKVLKGYAKREDGIVDAIVSGAEYKVRVAGDLIVIDANIGGGEVEVSIDKHGNISATLKSDYISVRVMDHQVDFNCNQVVGSVRVLHDGSRPTGVVLIGSGKYGIVVKVAKGG